MRICIATRHAYGECESFIRAHIDRLPAKVEVLWGRGLNRVGDSLELRAPLLLRIASLPVPGPFAQRRGRWLWRKAVTRYLRHGRFNAVLAQYGVLGARLADSCAEARVPLIVHFHGYDAYMSSVLEEQRDGYARMFRRCAAVVAVSRDMVEQLIGLGAPPEKVRYNPCGVDCELFSQTSPAENPPLFIGVGRFVEKKAPHLALFAFRRALEACPEAHLRLIGDGPLLPACRDLAKALGLGDAVELPGRLPHKEVAEAMAQARAFVQHSVRARNGDSEGTPVAVLEAGASGLSVVGTRHAGIADVVVEGETGLLVDEADVEGMAEHMIALSRDADLAARLGRAGRARVESEFSMAKSIAGLWQIIQDAVSGDG